jgi:hypothetical protein
MRNLLLQLRTPINLNRTAVFVIRETMPALQAAGAPGLAFETWETPRPSVILSTQSRGQR